MKKIKISILMLATIGSTLYISSCNKTDKVEPTSTIPIQNGTDPEEPEDITLNYAKKTRPVVFEFTSTGCPGCGSWGKPTFNKITTNNEGDVTPLAVHIKYGDPMITEESQSISSNRYGDFYTPQIWVGDSNAVVISGGYIQASSEQRAVDLIGLYKGFDQPSVSAHIKKEGGKLEVTYGVKFIDVQDDGQYRLACFLTEDGIVYSQSGSASNPTTHNHVLRASASGAYGASVNNVVNNEQKFKHSFDISSNDEANTYVTVILWKKVGDRYQPVNGRVIK